LCAFFLFFFEAFNKKMHRVAVLLLLLSVASCGDVRTVSEMLLMPSSRWPMHAAVMCALLDAVGGGSTALALGLVGVVLVPLPCLLADPRCGASPTRVAQLAQLALHVCAAALVVGGLLAALHADGRAGLLAAATALAAAYPPLCVVGALYGPRAAYRAGCICQLMLVAVYGAWREGNPTGVKKITTEPGGPRGERRAGRARPRW
jgi:hypothetical protein